MSECVDRYIDGTQLRLREQTDDGGSAICKLTQKVPERAGAAQQGFITTTISVNVTAGAALRNQRAR